MEYTKRGRFFRIRIGLEMLHCSFHTVFTQFNSTNQAVTHTLKSNNHRSRLPDLRIDTSDPATFRTGSDRF